MSNGTSSHNEMPTTSGQGLSLRWQILLATGTVILLSLIAFGFMVYSVSSKELTDIAVARVGASADAAASPSA